MLSKMFVRFELVKVTDKLKKKHIEGADMTTLKPCIYKRR